MCIARKEGKVVEQRKALARAIQNAQATDASPVTCHAATLSSRCGCHSVRVTEVTGKRDTVTPLLITPRCVITLITRTCGNSKVQLQSGTESEKHRVPQN